MKRFVLVLALCAACFTLHAQSKRITTQHLAWFNYNNNLVIGKNWFLLTNLSERVFIDPFKQHHFIAHVHPHYKLKHGFDAGAGMAFSFQSPNDPYSSSNLVVPEYRPFGEVNHKAKGRIISVGNRVRLEERYVHKTANGKLAGGYTNSFRGRYQLGFEYLYILNPNYTLKVKISNEIHFTAGPGIAFGTFDQNRLYGALAFGFTQNLDLEIGYMNWYQKKLHLSEYYNRHIIRLSINQRIKLAKKI